MTEKSINIRKIPEPLYNKVIKLKQTLNADNWVDFLDKIINILKDERIHVQKKVHIIMDAE